MIIGIGNAVYIIKFNNYEFFIAEKPEYPPAAPPAGPPPSAAHS